jgi:CRP-like cAMP-binding protein
MIVFASAILVVVALAALVAPGVGRPAAEWRRALTHLRATGPAGIGEVRPAAMGDYDRLVGRLATFTRLSDPQRAAFVRDALVREVPEGSRIVTHGEQASGAYFILDGEAAAGIPEADGGYRGLSTMGPGDVFGEIAALTGSPRTADVVATRDSTLLEVPAEALRAVMAIPEVNRLLLSTLTERLLRSNQPDLPRLASMDQAALRDLRTKAPTVEALPRAYD